MFKVNNTGPLKSFLFLLLTLTYATACSSNSIINFEHVIAGWVIQLTEKEDISQEPTNTAKKIKNGERE